MDGGSEVKIMQIGNPVLEKHAEPIIDLSSSEVSRIVDTLLDEVRKDTNSAGLAAPQIGESIRLCVVKRRQKIVDDNGAEHQKIEVFELINPVITKRSEKMSTYWEGCLSVGVGEGRLFAPVSRPANVIVEYLDRNGLRKSMEAAGFFSHVVQHEIDHLDGILFLSYVDGSENIWRSADLDKYIDEYDEMPPIKRNESAPTTN